MMRKTIFSLLVLLSLGWNSTLWADIAEEQQRLEATVFFDQLVKQTHNPLIARMAQANLSLLGRTTPRTASRSEVEVPLLLQANNSLAVPTLINHNTMATFLLDTGSTYTVITPAMARKLGVVVTKATPRISIITANGVVETPLVTLDRVTIGNLEVRNVQAVIQDLGDDPLLAGLLGINVFRGLELTIRENKLILRQG